MTTLDLVRRLAGAEAEGATRQFVAPRVAEGLIRATVEGLVSTYRPVPRDFVGWGMFRLNPDRTARVMRPATRPMIKQWLGRLKSVRLHLVRRLDDHTWLAWPADEAAFAHRCGPPRPVPVHLVSQGDAFVTVVARVDGAAFWFDRVDRRVDPRHPAALRGALRVRQPLGEVRLAGLTPEAKQAYALALGPAVVLRPERGAEPLPVPPEELEAQRLRAALAVGGGRLRDFVDRGDFWRVDWTDRNGQAQHSAVAKDDLTIISAGICLDGHDRNFDLQSLVGVVDGADYGW